MFETKAGLYSAVETLASFVFYFTVNVGFFNVVQVSTPSNFHLQMAALFFLATLLPTLCFSRVTYPKMNPLVSLAGLLSGRFRPTAAVAQLFDQLKGLAVANILFFVINTIKYAGANGAQITAVSRLEEPFPSVLPPGFWGSVAAGVVAGALVAFVSMIVESRHRENRLRGSLAMAGLALVICLGLGTSTMAAANPFVFLPLIVLTASFTPAFLIHLIVAPLVGTIVASVLMAAFSKDTLEDETIDITASSEETEGPVKRHDL